VIGITAAELATNDGNTIAVLVAAGSSALAVLARQVQKQISALQDGTLIPRRVDDLLELAEKLADALAVTDDLRERYLNQIARKVEE
jgi:hypothetical protein